MRANRGCIGAMRPIRRRISLKRFIIAAILCRASRRHCSRLHAVGHTHGRAGGGPNRPSCEHAAIPRPRPHAAGYRPAPQRLRRRESCQRQPPSSRTAPSRRPRIPSPSPTSCGTIPAHRDRRCQADRPARKGAPEHHLAGAVQHRDPVRAGTWARRSWASPTSATTPPEAKTITKIGGMKANLEKIVSLAPDLVLTIGGNAELVKRLEDLKLTVIVLDPKDVAAIFKRYRDGGQGNGARPRAPRNWSRHAGTHGRRYHACAGRRSPQGLLRVGCHRPCQAVHRRPRLLARPTHHHGRRRQRGRHAPSRPGFSSAWRSC